MMFVWKRVGTRFSARSMIMAAGIGVVVRWGIMAFSPPVAVLALTQILHALTYGVGYFGMVHFIAKWTREDVVAEAQGFSYVLQQGAAVSALAVFGWLVGVWHERAFLVAAGMGLLAILCTWLSMALRPASRDTVPLAGTP